MFASVVYVIPGALSQAVATPVIVGIGVGVTAIDLLTVGDVHPVVL